MKKGFEDKFVDLQSEFISLCLEVANHKVDKVYAYVSLEKKSRMFNAFFAVHNEVKTLNQLNIEYAVMKEFLKLGTTDLEKIKNLCEEYETKTPTEIKMYYDNITGEYTASYKYDAVCTPQTGINAGDVFINWVNEMKLS